MLHIYPLPSNQQKAEYQNIHGKPIMDYLEASKWASTLNSMLMQRKVVHGALLFSS